MMTDVYSTSLVMVKLLEAETALMAAMHRLCISAQHSEALEQEILALRSNITALAVKINGTQDGSHPAS